MTTAREVNKIILSDVSSGLGIRLTGGSVNGGERIAGIFVRKIMHGGAVDKHGVMKVGDEVLEINGKKVTGLTNSSAVDLLRLAAASNRVEILFASDDLSRAKFGKLISWKRKKFISEKLEHPADTIENSAWGDGDKVKKICVMKCQNGVGMTARQIIFEDSNTGISALEVDDIVPYGSIDVDGRLNPGDILLKFNGVDISNWKPLHLHSVFLREKLKSDPSFDVEYVPSGSSNKEILDIFASLKEKGEADLGAQDFEIPMDLTRISPMSENYFHKSPPQRTHILKSHLNRKRLTLDEGALVKVSKLEAALEYLGVIDPSPQDLKKLHSKLNKDENDMVEYGEFVGAVKEIFRDELSRSNIKRTSTGTIFGGQDSEVHNQKPLVSDKAVSTEDLKPNEMQQKLSQLEEENLKLQKTIITLHDEKAKLHESLTSYLHLLEKSRRDSTTLRQEIEHLHEEYNNSALKSPEQSLQPLEPHSSSKDLSEDLDEMRTRASLVDCEYRKTMEMRKTQEEVIRHLLHFTTRAASTGSLLTPTQDAWQELNALVEEAQQAVGAVKPLLEAEELPYGWEEAVLPDGSKYFINHADRTTSWSAPRGNTSHESLPEVFSTPRNLEENTKNDYPLITLSTSDSDTQDDL